MNKVIFCESAEKILETLRELYPVRNERKEGNTIVFEPQQGVERLYFYINLHPRRHHSCDSSHIYLPRVLFRSLTAEVVDPFNNESEYIVAHLWFHPGNDPNESCGHLVVTQRKGGHNEER